MTLLGIDISHHQGAIDFAKVKKAGYSFVVLKATEGIGYTDPMFTVNRKAAHAAGLTVGIYHFARAGDPADEADWFSSRVGSLSPGEFVVLDWEVGHSNPPAWCASWLLRVTTSLGVAPMIYMNQSARDGSDWTPAIRLNAGLWLAKYDGSQTVPSAGRWPVVTMKQFTDAGKVPGISGNVDLNVFYGDATVLARYGKGAPAPQQEEDPMAALSDADKDALMEMVHTFQSGRVGRRPGGGWERLDRIDKGVTVLLGRNADISALVDAIPDDIAQEVIDGLAAKLSAPAS